MGLGVKVWGLRILAHKRELRELQAAVRPEDSSCYGSPKLKVCVQVS